jgi:hypothetical protein
LYGGLQEEPWISTIFFYLGTGLVGEELKQLGFSNIDGSDMSVEILRKAEAKVETINTIIHIYAPVTYAPYFLMGRCPSFGIFFFLFAHISDNTLNAKEENYGKLCIELL